MTIQGAVVKEQGVKFGIVVVKQSAMATSHEAASTRASFQRRAWDPAASSPTPGTCFSSSKEALARSVNHSGSKRRTGRILAPGEFRGIGEERERLGDRVAFLGCAGCGRRIVRESRGRRSVVGQGRGLIALDEDSHDSASSFNTKGKRSDIQNQ